MKNYQIITDIYTGKNGKTYCSTSQSGSQMGERFFQTLIVPAGKKVEIGEKIDGEIGWDQVAYSDSPYKTPLKWFKRLNALAKSTVKSVTYDANRIEVTLSGLDYVYFIDPKQVNKKISVGDIISFDKDFHPATRKLQNVHIS